MLKTNGNTNYFMYVCMYSFIQQMLLHTSGMSEAVEYSEAGSSQIFDMSKVFQFCFFATIPTAYPKSTNMFIYIDYLK
jgi:hypothetical protein